MIIQKSKVMSKQTIPQYNWEEDIAKTILSMEQERLTLKEYQFLHKLKYYFKKYQTERDQLMVDFDKPTE